MNFPLSSSNYSTVKSLSIMIDEYCKICISLLLLLLCFGISLLGLSVIPMCAPVYFFQIHWIEVDTKYVNTCIIHKPHDAMILFDLILSQSDEQ